jgi:GAF domain-containing protein
MEHLVPFRDDELTVVISELLVATAESSDPLLDDTVSELLHAMRVRMQMDVVFVSEFVDGRRMFRHVDAAEGAPDIRPGGSSPAEESVCQRIVEGRVPELVRNLSAMPPEQLPPLPFTIGAHLSTPIVLQDKRVYGTLCCFSAAPRPDLVQADLDKLRLCATLVARKIQLSEARGIKEPPPDWQLEPMAHYESPVWQRPARGPVKR